MIKRYPCQAAVLLVLGILTAKGLPPGRQQEILLAAPASAAAALLLASWALREKAALKKLRQAMLLGLVFAAGMARMHAAAREAQRQTDGLFDGQAVTVQGRVTDKKLKETSMDGLPGRQISENTAGNPFLWKHHFIYQSGIYRAGYRKYHSCIRKRNIFSAGTQRGEL